MTASSVKKNIKTRHNAFPAIICIFLFAFALIYGSSLKDGVIYGLKLSILNIIPTLFPFFILSDLWSSVITFNEEGVVAKFFYKLFGLDGKYLSIFILGSICGFPLGVKAAAKKFDQGQMEKDELENLCSISNNPSAAFVISGVGMGIFSSMKIGIILYISMLMSAVISGITFKRKNKIHQNTKDNARQTFNLVESIKSAAMSSINVAAFIVFFSAVIGIIKSFVGNPLLLSLIASLLEVGSACSIIGTQKLFLGKLCIPLTAFALSFSGLSVFLQALSFLPHDFSKKKYLIMKIIQGIISALLASMLSFLLQ